MVWQALTVIPGESNMLKNIGQKTKIPKKNPPSDVMPKNNIKTRKLILKWKFCNNSRNHYLDKWWSPSTSSNQKKKTIFQWTIRKNSIKLWLWQQSTQKVVTKENQFNIINDPPNTISQLFQWQTENHSQLWILSLDKDPI